MLRVLVAVLVSIALVGIPQVSPVSAADCRFVLGFQTLHDAIPGVVGVCKVNEHYNAANGDALQETANGLLVWRKVDNFTAFTDGYRTWVSGPYGIQQRLNTERFEWEKEPVTVLPSCMPSSSDVAFTFTSLYDGSTLASGTMRNPCPNKINAIIDLWGQQAKDSPAVIDAPSAFVVDLPPGASKSFALRIPLGASMPWFSWRVASADLAVWCFSSQPQPVCVNLDPWLFSAALALQQVKDGPWLLKVAAEHHVSITRKETDIGTLGTYRSSSKTITIDTRLDAYSTWSRAAVLAHELQHAADDAAGILGTSNQCYRSEEAAFRREASVWAELWQNSLPPDVDSVHAELNSVTLAVSRDPVAFGLSLIPLYRDQCD